MIVPEFYANREIFVTGGSGVVGKALIDKLLRSCNVKFIYVLLRPKKDLSVEERLVKLKNAKIFRCLRNSKPDALDKLIAIPGDAVLPNLGITDEHMKMLENVSCIFHCAATVKFDEPLKVALRLNVGGTLEALKFAMTLKHLKLFMHVSTFFSNPYLTYVDNRVYESSMDWRVCLKLLENEQNESVYDILTKKMITGFGNTYTFTKNLSESLVNDFRDRLPVGIFRPSIVLFALQDPEPGFPPSLMGAMGLFALVGAGLLKAVYIGENVRLDLTPQDFGTLSMLYYGPKTAELYEKGVPAQVPVYMFSSSKSSPFTFKHMGESVEKANLWEEAAYLKSLLIPGAIYTSNRFLYMSRVFICQILPALLADFILILMGRRPVLMSIVRKGFVTLKVMEPFCFNNYDSPGITLLKEMEEAYYGTEFDFHENLSSASNQEGLDESIRKMTYKIREILLDEDPSTLPKARRILKIKKILYNTIRAMFFYVVLRWIYRKLQSYF